MLDTSMIAFVRNQGDIKSMKYSKQVVLETLIGIESAHVYVGMVAYSGTRIDCKESEMDVITFGRAEAKGHVFDRNIPFVSIELELTKMSDSNLREKILLRILGVTFYNGKFLPGKVRNFINACDKAVSPVLPPGIAIEVPTLAFILYLGIQLRFGVFVTIEFQLDLVTLICPSRLTLAVAVEPSILFNVDLKASGWFIVELGLKARLSTGYTLSPLFGTSSCNLCAVLTQSTKPIDFKIYLYSNVFGKEFNLYTIYEKRLISGTKIELFRLCIFPSVPFNPYKVIDDDDDSMADMSNMKPPKLAPVNSGLVPHFDPEPDPITPNICINRIHNIKVKFSDLMNRKKVLVDIERKRRDDETKRKEMEDEKRKQEEEYQRLFTTRFPKLNQICKKKN